jgi:hypothetical protein
MDRVICSGEKSCGCVIELKEGERIINPMMKECAKYIKGNAETVYCALTREKVHIIK